MPVIEINDIAAPELDCFARDSESQLLHKNEPTGEGEFIAESPYVIGLALDAGYRPLSVLCERDKLCDPVVKRLCDLPVYTADSALLTKIAGFKLTHGVLCRMQRKKLLKADEVCKTARRVVVLEQVMNPTNVGAIMRSCAALGMDAVLLSDDCSDPLYRRAARVSMGTVFQVPWTYFEKGCDKISLLKSLGFTSVALALTDRSVSIDNPELKQIKRLAIVMGSEGEGLCEKTIADCDYTAKIPMFNGVDSLNVAAASAIACYVLK